MAAHTEKETLSDAFIQSLDDNIDTSEKLRLLRTQLIELEKNIKIKEDEKRINQLKLGEIISSIYIYTNYDNEHIGFAESTVTVTLKNYAVRRVYGNPECDEILMPDEYDDFRKMFREDDGSKTLEYTKITSPEWLKHTQWLETNTQIKNHAFKQIKGDGENAWIFTGDHHDPEWTSFINIDVYLYYRLITIADLKSDLIYDVHDGLGDCRVYIRYTEENRDKQLRECDKKGVIDENSEDYLEHGWINDIIILSTTPFENEAKKQRTD